MSVRNILDGTIKVEGGDMETEIPENLEVTSVYAKDMVIAGRFNTRGLTETGNIEVSGAATVGTLTVLNNMSLPKLTVGGKATVGSLTVDSTDLLLQQIKAEGPQKLTGTLVGGEQKTYMATVKSFYLDLTDDLHVLNVQTVLDSCSTMSDLTIQSGLMLDRGYKVHTITPCVVGDSGSATDFVDAVTYIYMEDGQLMCKLFFKTTPEYSSMAIRINLTLH